MANNPKTILGLDVGRAWIGVARASTVVRLAEPLKTIKTGEAETEIKKMIDDYDAVAVVVGLPRNLDGHDTHQTKWSRQWAEQLKSQLKLPVYLIDEALTSQDADHSEAAARILQDWLDQPVDRSQPGTVG